MEFGQYMSYVTIFFSFELVWIVKFQIYMILEFTV